MFRSWAGRLPSDVEMVAVRLPGRESRFAETPYDDWDRLVADVAAELRPLLDRPAVLFGHSFGAMLAYEVTCELGRAHAAPASALIVSACRAPGVPPSVAGVPHDAPSADLWDWVNRMNGTPSAVLDDAEIRDAFEPALRADLKLANAWTARGPRETAVPITAFAGTADRFVSPNEIEAWRGRTSRSYERVTFRGDHFFIHTLENDVVAAVAGICRAA